MTQRTLVFWNVQRLFGSAGNPIEVALSNQTSGVNATAEEVDKKTSVIAAVLDHIAEVAGPPLVVGMAEIETDELCGGIGERMQSVPMISVDQMGVDRAGVALDGLNIAMLVDPGIVVDAPWISSHVIDRSFRTRDVLECHLDLGERGPLTVLVNHWPSRLSPEAEGRRLAAAHYVNRLIAAQTRYGLLEMWDAERKALVLPKVEDMEARAREPVVVMGDFNDEPFSPSVELLGATDDAEAVREELDLSGSTHKERLRSYTASTPRLYNPWWANVGRGGSFYRSPRWRLYDQILVNRGFLADGSPVQVEGGANTICQFNAPRLAGGEQWKIVNAGGKPIAFDLAKGRGCSDHFAIYLTVEVRD